MESRIKEVVVKTEETPNLKMRKPNILKEQYKVHDFIDIHTIPDTKAHVKVLRSC